jgi:hypothetical protein
MIKINYSIRPEGLRRLSSQLSGGSPEGGLLFWLKAVLLLGYNSTMNFMVKPKISF